MSSTMQRHEPSANAIIARRCAVMADAESSLQSLAKPPKPFDDSVVSAEMDPAIVG
jgi:hypothetical protein